MNENEALVTEKVAENVETATEESPKIYTEDELNAKLDEILGKRLSRKEAKIRKEYEKKYGNLEEVLKAGTGKQSLSEITDSLKQYYESKGVRIPDRSDYSARDIEVLAKAEADDIINAGFEEVVEEVERLAKLGASNMTAKDKVLFKVLAEHRQDTERKNELENLGVTEDVYESKDFKDFARKFNANTPIADIYDIYTKTLPKKEIKPMGSMKNSTGENGGVKDFYTREEALRFTKKDFDKNPALYKAVEASMLKW